MNRIITTLLVATAMTANAMAQSDTLVVSKPDEVTIHTLGDTLNVCIKGAKDNPNYYYNKTVVVDAENEDVTTTSSNASSKLGWDFSLIERRNTTSIINLTLKAQVYTGWNIPLGRPSGMKLKGIGCIETGLDIIHFSLYPRANKWWVSMDWGFNYSRYKFKNCMMTTLPDGSVAVTDKPDGSKMQTSFSHIFSGNIALMGHYRFGKDHAVGLGAAWSPRIADNGCYKAKYTLADGTSVVSMNELPVCKNIFSIKAEYMFANNIGLYMRYTPMSIFQKGKGPSFQQLNVGLQMNF